MYHPRGLSCTLSLAQHHHSSCQIPPAVPEPKLVYVPTGNQMPLNVRSLELPGWGEQFVPIRAALRKCPICNADTSSHEHRDTWERAQNQPLTSPWHQASASCTGGQAATSPPSAGGVFESSPVIALHLLYWQLRSTPNAPQHSVHGGGLLLLKMETSSALIRKKVFANVEHLPLLNYLSFSSKDNSQRNSWLDWKQNY